MSTMLYSRELRCNLHWIIQWVPRSLGQSLNESIRQVGGCG
jgi:hypothetical protein